MITSGGRNGGVLLKCTTPDCDSELAAADSATVLVKARNLGWTTGLPDGDRCPDHTFAAMQDKAAAARAARAAGADRHTTATTRTR
jgi:hypothetical protein